MKMWYNDYMDYVKVFFCKNALWSIVVKGKVIRQQVAFKEECRKIKGFGSLREDFYTRFIPILKDLGL